MPVPWRGGLLIAPLLCCRSPWGLWAHLWRWRLQPCCQVGQITTEPFEGALRNQSQVEVNYMTQIISKHCITQKSPYRMEISDCFGGGSAVYHSDCSVFEPVFSCLHISLSKIGEGNLNRPWKQMRRTQGAPAASLQCVESRIEHRAFAVRCFLERSLRLHLMCHTLLGSAVLGKYE